MGTTVIAMRCLQTPNQKGYRHETRISVIASQQLTAIRVNSDAAATKNVHNVPCLHGAVLSRATSKYHWCRSLDNTTSSSTCKYCFKNRRGTLRCEKQGQVGAISTAGANTTVSRIIDPDCDCGMGMNAQRSCRHAGSPAEKHATPPKAYLCKILL